MIHRHVLFHYRSIFESDRLHTAGKDASADASMPPSPEVGTGHHQW
jgi:hypothetical protein